MRHLQHFLLDVFTDRCFSGNPLAVFPHAVGEADATMQQIASELNLSETVFVGQPTATNRFPVRIFTPARELPFAGHPTIGAALLLAELGLLEGVATGPQELVLDQRVGPIPVGITRSPSGPSARFRTARLPEISPSRLSRADAAALVGLDTGQLVADAITASCGVPFQLIEVADLAALGEAVPDLALWRRLLASDPAPDLYCFSRPGATADIRARMFAPSMDIAEDPATGAAAAALAGHLASLRDDDQLQFLVIEQGVEIGRPSRIVSEVAQRHGRIDAVYIGGQAVVVGEGTLRLG